jgi:hypothetical protein
MLEQSAGLASIAAAIHLEAGKNMHQALELLELGRCIIAGLLLEIHTDLSDLDHHYPALVAEFKSFRDELDSRPSKTTPLDDTISSWRSEADQRLSVREQCQLGAADKRLYCYLLLLCCDVQELSAPR